MKSTLCRSARRSLFVLGAIAIFMSIGPREVASSASIPSVDSVASIREARLRKLHLVRPDLINYPIASDVLC